MAVITPGSGATISVTKLEEFFAGAIWLLQTLEADSTRNPTAINNVTSSANDDSQTMTANINFRAGITSDSNGNASITCIDYLVTPSGAEAHWTPGTGGTIKSATLQGAIFEAARLIDSKENNSSTNSTGAKNVTWNISNGEQGSTSSVVQISVSSFPLVITISNGTATLKGKEYLS